MDRSDSEEMMRKDDLAAIQQQHQHQLSADENMYNLTSASGDQASGSSSHSHPAPPPRADEEPERSLPGNPDPDAEAIALSPRTLMATNPYVCEVCDKGFEQDQELQLHRHGLHNLPVKLKQQGKRRKPKNTKKVVPKKVYVCPEPGCVHHDPARAIGDLTSLKMHFSRKHWHCDPTEVIALSPETLLVTNCRFVCEVCNKGFQREQNLQLHRRGHNLPWKLKQKNRPLQAQLRRVYVCPEPTCVLHDPARALGDFAGIKKHFSRKHGEKKWKCDKCDKRYAVRSDLKAHSKTCGTSKYKCDGGTLFARRDEFITHRAFCDALAQESARLPPAPAFAGHHHQGMLGDGSSAGLHNHNLRPGVQEQDPTQTLSLSGRLGMSLSLQEPWLTREQQQESAPHHDYMGNSTPETTGASLHAVAVATGLATREFLGVGVSSRSRSRSGGDDIPSMAAGFHPSICMRLKELALEQPGSRSARPLDQQQDNMGDSTSTSCPGSGSSVPSVPTSEPPLASDSAAGSQNTPDGRTDGRNKLVVVPCIYW